MKKVLFYLALIFIVPSSGWGNGELSLALKNVVPKLPAYKPVPQLSSHSKGEIRIKDIVNFQGVRENQLVGYGLVVGLNKTGDTLSSNPFTQESLVSMLERLGVNVRDQTPLSGQNVAAVMVTADLPSFSRKGARMDVSVSSIGSAKDLRGGTLLVTPLMGADGEVYAVAQGSVATGGYSATALSQSSVTKGIPTTGRIANGAIVEREIQYELQNQKLIQLSLKNPDFTTALRIAEAINAYSKVNAAIPLDPTTINLTIPNNYSHQIMPYLANIEQLMVEPDQPAKVIIDEQNGIIVMGDHVRISPVAISQGNLTIRIDEATQVSQPNPFATVGQTATVQRSNISVDDPNRKMAVLPKTISLHELVNALNALGVGPQDMIMILGAIKAAGALQADIEVM